MAIRLNLTSWGWSFGLTEALETFSLGWGGGGWEKLGIKLKLSFSLGFRLLSLTWQYWSKGKKENKNIYEQSVTELCQEKHLLS